MLLRFCRRHEVYDLNFCFISSASVLKRNCVTNRILLFLLFCNYRISCALCFCILFAFIRFYWSKVDLRNGKCRQCIILFKWKENFSLFFSSMIEFLFYIIRYWKQTCPCSLFSYNQRQICIKWNNIWIILDRICTIFRHLFVLLK